MNTWRVARGLETLLSQINTKFPKRSKASDGGIGDAEHATRDSDHNPWYGPGIVTARDFTHDKVNGVDCQVLADQLVASKDPRIKYVIWNKRIIDSRTGCNPWKWMPYNGANPHTKHLHLSVMDSKLCDSTEAWDLPMFEEELTPAMIKKYQAFFNRYYSNANLVIDGIYGKLTAAQVSRYQKNSNLPVTGKLDIATRTKIGVK